MTARRTLALDVSSALRGCVQDSLDSFTWPVPPPTYERLSYGLVSMIDRAYSDGTFGESARIALALCSTDLADDYRRLLGGVLTLRAARRNGLNVLYDRETSLYGNIESGRFPRAVLGDPVPSVFWPVRSRSPRRILGDLRRSARLAWQAVEWRIRRPSVYVIAPNYHLNEWQPPDAFHLNHLAYSAAKNRARSQAELPSGLQEIHDFLVINASEIMAEIETPLTNEERAYVCQIAQAHLVYALRACRYPVERFVKTEGSLLLTGTGGGFGIRLLSHAFQRNGSPVVRFSHGGVRSLRDDWRWHMIELAFTDTYVVHGRIEAERVRQSVETKTIGMTATGLKIVAAGSKRFGTLLREAAVIQSEGRIHRVMVMASSFLGEQKLAFTSIPEDMVYLDWQIRLLRSLRGGRFRVISNRHPRGQHADAMVFGGYSDEEMIGGRFAEQHQLADAFVLDDAGTALVEALCTMKPVVFVDLPYRPIAAASRVDLEKCCPIIAASFDEENRIVADFDAIRQALDAPVESDARQSFVRDYFTEGEAEIGILERLKTA